MAGFTSWEMINAEELQDYVEENGVSRADEYVSSRLDDWRNVDWRNIDALGLRTCRAHNNKE